jgi:glycosyltransferase involved in cell wall biosynthesis
MPANHLYYNLKPYLPWRIRMTLRRIMARRKRKAYQDVWPINEAAGRPPDGWPGWPEGKKFAFVLTHDVEGPAGLAKCQRLMQLEKELGFRSSFNFIPEGDYAVSRELREELAQNGFEVGVHDLHHDGKLYRSRQDFSEKAKWINHYLKEWGAAGFRSGFMLRQMDWIHDLNIQYDASTFDTDPFEPQPDGTGTIFPFWVPRPLPLAHPMGEGARRTGEGIALNSQPSTSNADGADHASCLAPRSSRPGYVELPYTLVQDSTLFLVLREPTPEIWFRKLDWIVQHGGMALVNVHPDYLRFPGEPASPRTFPVALYVELLEYVGKRHAGVYWQPLSKEIARHVSSIKPVSSARKRRRACIVSYSIYETDTRVFRYGKALAERGDEVDAIVLSGSRLSPVEETIDGVRVHRIQTREGNKERSKLSYLLPLLRFLVVAGWRIARMHAQRPYDLIHVHNVPDFLVFAALRPKLGGAKVILDIHDLVPEFFGSKFGAAKASNSLRLLKWMERASASFADHVIVANDLWLGKYASRSATPGKCSVLINYVDRQVFFSRPRLRKDKKLIVLFPGGLQWHQGLDIAIRAFNQLKDRLPQVEFHIYGEGNAKPGLVQLVHELGLEEKVRFFGLLSTTEIAEVMANADVGVVPKRADSFGNEAYSTKIMEFMSLGVPVVVSSTKIDRFYFNDSVVRFFESGNPDALAEAVVEVLQNNELRRRMIANALEYADQNSWQRRQGDYLELVDSLIENRPVTLDGSKSNAPSDNKSGRESRAADVAGETERLAVK